MFCGFHSKTRIELENYLMSSLSFSSICEPKFKSSKSLSLNLNVDPSEISDLTSMVPPNYSKIVFDRFKPRPIPCTFILFES